MTTYSFIYVKHVTFYCYWYHLLLLILCMCFFLPLILVAFLFSSVFLCHVNTCIILLVLVLIRDLVEPWEPDP